MNTTYAATDGHTHCAKCGHVMTGDWRDHSVACSDRRPPPLDVLNDKIVEAVIAYDASGDHRHAGSPIPGDCVRCNVVASLHPWAQRKIEAAATTRRRA